MDRAVVTRRVWELAEPLALAQGLELVDVQYRPEGGRMVLRLLADRPAGGVTLDELARLSRELSDVLDGHDAVPGRYTLECSSPGLNRPLLREPHFRRALGQRVSLRVREPIAGRRQFHGVLEAVTPDGVTVRDPDAGPVHVAFATIERANTEYDFARPAGTPPGQA
ncbi:MAG TPA: ribosome maturation factor RimP [Candidatus Binatia bacterium]|nr:ribosome maturation factor RimP [Candidatus Binatia bacterium]